jgi:hypothetical protein
LSDDGNFVPPIPAVEANKDVLEVGPNLVDKALSALYFHRRSRHLLRQQNPEYPRLQHERNATMNARTNWTAWAVMALAFFWVGAGTARADFVATATLLGVNETPPNGSPAMGFIEVDFNAPLNQLHIHETFSGLVAPDAAGHIHVGPEGVAGPIVLPFSPASGFPVGVTAGTYDAFLGPADLTPAGGVNTFDDLIAQIEAGNTYANVHSTMFPGGEIRGQLQTVPEPASFTLAALGALGLLVCRRWNRPA